MGQWVNGSMGKKISEIKRVSTVPDLIPLQEILGILI